MIVEYNIEAEDLDQAAQFVNDVLPGGQLNVKTRVAIAKYEGPNGPEQNGVLIVRAVVPNIFEAMGFAFYFATIFEQDCVALYCPASQCGWLVGPNAAKWGKFDITYFRGF